MVSDFESCIRLVHNIIRSLVFVYTTIVLVVETLLLLLLQGQTSDGIVKITIAADAPREPFPQVNPFRISRRVGGIRYCNILLCASR